MKHVDIEQPWNYEVRPLWEEEEKKPANSSKNIVEAETKENCFMVPSIVPERRFIPKEERIEEDS